MNEPSILYHYTSLETLFAIINGINNEDENNVFFTLRATHASFLNDETEGRLLPNVLHDIGVEDSTLFIFQGIEGYPFACSLSELGDDLNMWRCYAKDGMGVAIGLNYYHLKEQLEDQLNRIEYVTHEELKERLISEGVIQKLNNEDKSPLLRLLNKALNFKHSSFSAEKEWRISDLSLEHGFRTSNGLIIPYIEFKIPTSVIETITLGPKCEFTKNKFSIYRMLKSKISPCELATIDITKSQVPLL